MKKLSLLIFICFTVFIIYLFIGSRDSITSITSISGEIDGTTIGQAKKVPEEEYNKLIAEAAKYKGLGDRGETSAYIKAIEYYQRASDLSDNTLFIPVFNIANVYKLTGQYEKADEYYNKALKIAPDSMIFLAQIELHELYLKSPTAVIQKLYDTALKTTIENTNLYLQYASFLKKNGFYEDALNIYETLANKYPQNVGFKTSIQEIRKLIGKS